MLNNLLILRHFNYLLYAAGQSKRDTLIRNRTSNLRGADAASDRSPTVYGSNFAYIPRIIHQTWKTANIPGEWREFHETWRRHHPDWEIRVWTDEDNRQLIEQEHPWFLSTYDSFERDIQRVDAAKYFILYTHGGVYADLDCECLMPVDELVDRGGAVFGKSADRVIECAFIASSPAHPIWRDVFYALEQPSLLARGIRSLPSALGKRGFDAAHVLFHTGPQMMRRVVRQYRKQVGTVGEGITVLPSGFLSDRSWWDRHESQQAPTGYIEHHYSNSWIESDEGKYVNRFTRSLLMTIGASVAVFSLLLVSVLANWNVA